MLTPGNVIYGFCNSTNPPKDKFLISLHRDSNFTVIACFTTSRKRARVPVESIKHGINKNSDGEVVSYVFLKNNVIGTAPDGRDFQFQKETSIPFDYCFQKGGQPEILSGFTNPEVVCKLHKNEYLDLIYAMYKSEDTPNDYKSIFEKILNEQCK